MKFCRSPEICSCKNDYFYEIIFPGTNFWLAAWSDDPDSAIPSIRDMYLGVYGGLGAASAITVMFSSLLTLLGGLAASNKLHTAMLGTVQGKIFHALRYRSLFDCSVKVTRLHTYGFII